MGIEYLSLKDLLDWYGDDPNIADHWVKLNASAEVPFAQLSFQGGDSNFGGPSGVTITHNLNLLNYIPDITPTEDSGDVGAIWVTDISVNSFIVHNSGIGTSSFTWVVRKKKLE